MSEFKRSWRYYFVLDSDADIDSENFTKLIDVFKNNPDIGILEPRIIRAHDSVIINEPKSCH